MANHAAASVVLPYDSVTQLHLILTKKAADRDRDGWFQATRAELAARLGASPATVTSGLQKLVGAGWLQLRRPTPDARRAGQGTRYRLTFFLSGPEPAPDIQAVPDRAPNERTAERPPSPARAADAPTPPAVSATPPTNTPPVLSTSELLRATTRTFDDDAFAAAVQQIREGLQPTLSGEDRRLAQGLVEMQAAALPLEPSTADRAAARLVANKEPTHVLTVLQTPQKATKPTPSYATARLRTAFKRIESHASGNVTWALRTLAEILWSSREGHLARCGRSAIDVGLKLVEADRWSTPYGLSDAGLQAALKQADLASIPQGQFSCH